MDKITHKVRYSVNSGLVLRWILPCLSTFNRMPSTNNSFTPQQCKNDIAELMASPTNNSFTIIRQEANRWKEFFSCFFCTCSQ